MSNPNLLRIDSSYHQNTLVKVGKDALWDTNSVYSSIQHDGQVVTTPEGVYCSSLGGCTYDLIYNLFLKTALYNCLLMTVLHATSYNGIDSWIYWDFENRAATVLVGGDGYGTIGDQTSFVKNNPESDY